MYPDCCFCLLHPVPPYLPSLSSEERDLMRPSHLGLSWGPLFLRFLIDFKSRQSDWLTNYERERFLGVGKIADGTKATFLCCFLRTFRLLEYRTHLLVFCICMCVVCVCVCMCVGTWWACMYVYRLEIDVESFPWLVSTLFTEEGSLTELGAFWF